MQIQKQQINYLEIGKILFFISSISYLFKVTYTLIFGSINLLTSTISDDGFYYWLIAKNITHIGISSADFGQTLTSGYHPLWAWMLAPLTLIKGSEIQDMKIIIFISALISIYSLIIFFKLLPTSKLSKYIAFGIIISSFSFQVNSMSGMEWPIIFLCNVIFIGYLIKGNRSLLNFVVIGILASMARTDFGAVPFIFFIYSLGIYLINKNDVAKYYMKGSFATAIGAILGLALVAIYFYVTTGQVSQGSALVKHMWVANGFRVPLSTFLQFSRAIFYIPDLSNEINSIIHSNAIKISIIAVLGLFLIIIIFYKIIIRNFKKNRSQYFIMLVVPSALIVIFYLFFYAFNIVEVQPWYTAQIMVPVAIMLSSLLQLMIKVGRTFYKALFVSSLLIMVNVLISFGFMGPFSDQVGTKNLGLYLKNYDSGVKIGYSGSGVVSFFQGGRVINLDGLVNNEIYYYMPKKLPCYLIDKKIDYFNDFGASERFFKFNLQELNFKKINTGVIGISLYKVDAEIIRKNYNCN